MLQLKNGGLWFRAWVLLPISILLVFTLIGIIAQRWRMLHGTTAQAFIHQKLYNEAMDRSGLCYMIVKYQHPQQAQTLYAKVQTGSNVENLTIGQRIGVCYADDPQRALLATESSYNGKLFAMTLVTIMLLYDGATANCSWRNRRRNGCLPD